MSSILPAVAQKQVLADGAAQHLFHLMAEFDGVRVLVVHPDIGNTKLVQLVVDGQLRRDAFIRGPAGVLLRVDLHDLAYPLFLFCDFFSVHNHRRHPAQPVQRVAAGDHKVRVLPLGQGTHPVRNAAQLRRPKGNGG